MTKRPHLPTPMRLSLSGCVDYIAAKTEISAVGTNISTSLHDALRSGVLVARGRYQDHRGNIIEADRAVPTEVWEDMGGMDFFVQHGADRYSHRPLERPPGPPGVLYLFVIVTIGTADLDRWLVPDTNTVLTAGAGAKCKQWLRKFVDDGRLNKTDPQTGRKYAKASIWEQAKTEIPALSERMFNSVWKDVAQSHPEMKDPGRKRQGHS